MQARDSQLNRTLSPDPSRSDAGRWPTFLGVGAAKSGTTALYRYLMQHPDVYMSPIKEPNFFSDDIDPELFRKDYKLHERQKRLDVAEFVKGPMDEPQWGAYVRDPGHYTALFRFAAPGQACGEISNSYLPSAVACDRILGRIPDARIFMILRNPVDRAYSHYLANVRDGRAIRPFREEIEADLAEPRRTWGCAHLYLDLGMYAAQVRRYRERFGPGQLRVYLYDDLKRDPGSVVRDLFGFIGVRADVPVDVGTRHNTARVPRSPRLVYAASALGLKKPLFKLVPRRFRSLVKERFFRGGSVPPLSPALRGELVERFRDDIVELQRLIDRDLSGWLE